MPPDVLLFGFGRIPPIGYDSCMATSEYSGVYRSEDPLVNPKGWMARATERLQAEGRWELFREEWKAESARLKREGLAEGSEASERSFGTVIVKYPPVGKEEMEAIAEAEDDPWLNQEVTIDFIADIEWVYQNIGRTGLRKRDCPSSGAWEMLAWAKGRREKFYEQMVPKALAQRDKRVEEGEGEDDDGLRLLDKLLEEGE